MAKLIKELPGEMIFEPTDLESCPGCMVRDSLCNRFGNNGYRSLVIVGTRPERVGCDVKVPLLARRAELGLE